MALFNAKRCIFEHDQCRNTFNFPHSGQNLHLSCSSTRYLDNKEVILKGTSGWFNEYKDCAMDEIREFKHRYEY